jgi:hypothetical protein
LTSASAALPSPLVARLPKLLSFLLVALWLPATLHCEFEAVGLDALFRCDVDHHAPAAKNPHAADACDVLENGWMKRASAPIALAAPTLFTPLLSFVCPLFERPLLEADAQHIDALAAPPEFTRAWQFVARAAPPARAPSVVS